MTPTPAGESILADAERMEEAANGVERRLAGRADAARGRVRISATEGMGIHWLPRRLAPFRARNPGIELDIQVTNFAADLARREADIALRIGPQPGVRPGQGELITRRAGHFGLGLYASPAYLARRGTPRHADEVGEHDLIGFGSDVDRFPQFAWLKERLGGRPFSLVTNSLLAMSRPQPRAGASPSTPVLLPRGAATSSGCCHGWRCRRPTCGWWCTPTCAPPRRSRRSMTSLRH